MTTGYDRLMKLMRWYGEEPENECYRTLVSLHLPPKNLKRTFWDRVLMKTGAMSTFLHGDVWTNYLKLWHPLSWPTAVSILVRDFFTNSETVISLPKDYKNGNVPFWELTEAIENERMVTSFLEVLK